MSHILHQYLVPYVPKSESIKFFSWNNMMWGDDTHETPKIHYQIVDEVLGGYDRVAMEVFRGGAKTTVMSHKMPLYVGMLGRMPNFGNVKNAVLLSATYEQADNQLQSCMAYWSKSEKLQGFLNLEKRKEGMLLFSNSRGDRLHISARGAGQSFRGTNFEGQRPQWIIGDDLLPDEVLYSTELSEKIKKWWTGTVMQAVDISRYKVTVIGTPMLQDDLIRSLVTNPQYHSIRLPVAEEFPSKNIISAWGDRFTPERIWTMYNEAKHLGTENDFFREMMLEVVNDDMRVFKREWIKRYKWSELRKQKFELNFFTSMDLAVSKKQHSDYSVIITIGVNSSGHWFIVRVDRGRYTPSEVIDKLFAHVREFNPLEVRAEKAALQQVLDHFIEEKMLKEKTHFLYNPLENNSIQKKEYRILGLQPLFKNRMVYFPDDICYDEVAALEKEILGFTKQGSTVKNDDAIDCLANFLDPDFIFKPNDYKRDDNVVYGYNTSIKDPTIF